MYSTALDRTEEIATYMKETFINKLHLKRHTNSFPLSWSLHFLQECDHAVNILVEAYFRREKTTWLAEEYARSLTPRCTGLNLNFEEKLSNQYPPIHCPSKHISEPCTVTDRCGNFLIWYLPGILTERRQILLWDSLKTIESSFTIAKNSSSWRVSPDHYTNLYNGLNPGTLNLSPAWFQQGHEASFRFLSATHQIEVSAQISKIQHLEWLQNNLDAFALLGGILAIMHPELYEAGCRALKLIIQEPDRVHKGYMLKDIFQVWASPYNVVSVISNRQTPLHRDSGGAFSWPDTLLALGCYDHGKLSLPGLGIQLRYRSGTVVGILSRLIRHGAECNGQRACVAFYMKEMVLKELKMESVGWMNTSFYE